MRGHTALAAILLACASGCALSERYVREGALEAAPQREGAAPNSVILIGDAGEPAADRLDPVFAALRADLSRAHTQSRPRLVVFLGDNVYPNGVPWRGHPDYPEARRRLEEQIRILEGFPSASALFLSGNHDWRGVAGDGTKGPGEEARLVEELARARNVKAQFEPAIATGAMAPTRVVGEPRYCGPLAVIPVDTTLWIRELTKARWSDSGSESAVAAVSERIGQELKVAVDRARERPEHPLVIVAGHHTLESYGNHGARFSWKDHLFFLGNGFDEGDYLPLPILGSLYVLLRGSGVMPLQDDQFSQPGRRFRASLEQALKLSRPLAYACGHEHALQILRKDGLPWLLVSGAGYFRTRAPHVEAGPLTLAASPRSGYLRIDAWSAREIELVLMEVSEDGTRVESHWRMTE